MLFVAILVGRLISALTRFLKLGGGSAAPGLYALKIDPNLVSKLASRIPRNIVITGTNGKTTTARMLAHFARSEGLRVIRNTTGSNLERGIASTLLQASHLSSGSLTSIDLGIWELDEAAFNSVAPKLKPDLVVFLNLSRDQLDRYGEIDSVLSNWNQTLSMLPKSTTLILNSDDQKVASLAKSFPGKSLTFSLNQAREVKLDGLIGSTFSLSFTFHLPSSIFLPLPGLYHISDFLAAFTAGTKLGLDPQKSAHSLKDFTPAFGRVEKFSFPHRKWEGKVHGYIFLIKNPAGATEVFRTLSSELKANDRLLIALNDNLADGTDVSWIWDAEFEQLLTPVIPAKAGIYTNGSRIKSGMTIMVSGSRAEDLALRLKYAGVATSQLIVEKGLNETLAEAKQGLTGRLFILPTYTALLELQSILAKSGVKGHYWNE